MNGTDKGRCAKSCRHPAASALLKPFLNQAGEAGKSYVPYGEDRGNELTLVRPLPEAVA